MAGVSSPCSSPISMLSYRGEDVVLNNTNEIVSGGNNPTKTKMKCGELYFSDQLIISYSCVFCGSECFRLAEYLEHMLQHDLALLEMTLQQAVERRAIDVRKEQEVEVPNAEKQVSGHEVVEQPSSTSHEDAAQTSNDGTLPIDIIEDFELLVDAMDEDPRNHTVAYEFELLAEDNVTQADDESTENNSASTSITFDCDICGHTFKSKCKLNVHRKRHTTGRPYACEFCDASFAVSSNLRVHRYRHLGIKPHSCALCEKSFTSSSELKLHSRTHTGERPYMCADCGQSFTNSAHLTAHRRRHRNERRYVCTTCGKRFYDSRLLRSHEAAHSSARPFECEVCHAQFSRRKSLMEHVKLHSDVRRYNCKICGKAFAQNSGLHSHLRKQHAVQR